ncbi:MAG: ComF family protein [Candidatus Marinimicrobia bacterium]|nr:ComF family protein [Candidatus Neomarinimicrobiota bacterium]
MTGISTIMKPFSPFGLMAMDLVFPNLCLSCDEPILRSKQSLCESCLGKLQSLSSKPSIEHLTVKDGVDEAFVGWAFSDELRAPIHSLKYQDRALLGKELGKMLGNKSSKISWIDYLIPVPLHAVKERDRGYNQADWIAKGLGEKWNIPVKRNMISRIKQTETQTALNQIERRENMNSAFHVHKDVSGASIGIVDDVLTTGSTISSMAVELKKAGAQKIIALTVATPLEKKHD